MQEQVQKAATGEDESRYSQFTLADMRANLEGEVDVSRVPRPGLSRSATAEAPRRRHRIQQASVELEGEYTKTMGAAIPP